MRDLVYHIACSLDGFIARPDGSWEGFLEQGDHVDDYLDSLKSYDTVVMGRHTYEVGLQHGVTNPYPHMRAFVATRSMAQSPDENVVLIREDLASSIAALKAEDGSDIYLCGGGSLATALLQLGLIDRLLVKLNPNFFGDGIPMFLSGSAPQLSLLTSKRYASGVILNDYEITDHS